MEQEIKPQQTTPSNNKRLIIAIVISVLVTAIIVGFGVYLLTINSIDNKIQNQKSELETNPQQFAPTNNGTERMDESISNSAQTEEIYFAKGWQGEYVLVDINNGVTKEFIPAGYEIVDQHEYDPLPDFLILKKDNNLFSYEIENGSVNKIFTSNDLLFNSNESAHLYPSITEKNSFFIVINEYDPNEEPGMGLSYPISNRSYFFDALVNKLVETKNINFSGCAEYDSKNQRFFSWSCGEGIGSSIPLSILDTSGKKQKEIISLSEFGLKPDDLGPVAVEYNSGLFFALPKGSVDKIVLVDPTSQEIQKETYTATEAVKSQIKNSSYPYSITVVKSQNTFVIGGDSYITLLRFAGNQITESKVIPEPELYANFIFPHNNLLYYQSKSAKAVRAIDLNTWQIVKTIPIEINEEITIIKKYNLPE